MFCLFVNFGLGIVGIGFDFFCFFEILQESINIFFYGYYNFNIFEVEKGFLLVVSYNQLKIKY